MIPQKKIRKRDESLLFLKTLMKNPKSLGAIAPSSVGLCELIAKNVYHPDEHYVLEIGAGTGRITRKLLSSGINPSKIYVVELDPHMCVFLREKLPDIHVIEGDACRLTELLPQEVISKISTVISGIPMINLSKELQGKIIQSCFSVMAKDGILLQFTYGPVSPISSKVYGLYKKRIGHILLNMPPAFLWMYKNKAYLEKPPKRLYRQFEILKDHLQKRRKINPQFLQVEDPDNPLVLPK